MNTFNIVARPDPDSEILHVLFKSLLLKNNWKLSEKPELVIFIGGDGTMLEAFRQFQSVGSKFVGVHTGTLGFYADWEYHEANEFIENILSNKPYLTTEYPLVDIELETKNGQISSFVGLNEAVIKSKTTSTFVLDVFVNQQKLETFRGDGLIVSTPSGSTGYSHSVFGAITHPTLEAIQISELAAINNKHFRTLNRPFILPKHHSVELYPKNPEKDILISVDGSEIQQPGIHKISLKVSDEKVQFVRYRNYPFWDRVRRKFIE